MTSEHSWHVVAGFGAHIKSTGTTLSILYKGEQKEFPLPSVHHLLLVGGHNIHTSAVTRLLRQGSSISFFDADGTPVGMLNPFGSDVGADVRKAQRARMPHTFAQEIARATLKSRLLAIERTGDQLGENLFYEGEQEILHNLLKDLEYLITMDELRRVHKLAGDMYYEIMARSLSPELGFRRRTKRPHQDPVNAMLSLGYAMLFGNTIVSVIGAYLDPDYGFLREGERSLVADLIDPIKTTMVDEVVFSIARAGLIDRRYEVSTKRCHLNEEVIDALIAPLRESIKQELIDSNVLSLSQSLMGDGPFFLGY
ncbi:CRISPR-associated endonuclease Cas1 [Methanogenium organophilum]|uniref:CRISPR-associated endonuclease Cas1 n=1 Tax=Methanogenium organophilum TaxID=2199 RepID=A0A9X9S2Z1_METOG|nr:CRISPR-associated endonuclease Cas1 [Methanogenium organophilum]WAI00568.1 CRISPR-associated endonuclease Cas1 [Methanogenium organophilum]